MGALVAGGAGFVMTRADALPNLDPINTRTPPIIASDGSGIFRDLPMRYLGPIERFEAQAVEDVRLTFQLPTSDTPRCARGRATT
jgi:hypothetical protein